MGPRSPWSQGLPRWGFRAGAQIFLLMRTQSYRPATINPFSESQRQLGEVLVELHCAAGERVRVDGLVCGFAAAATATAAAPPAAAAHGREV